MRLLVLSAFLCFSAAFAQTAPQTTPQAHPAAVDLPSDTVIATFGNGKKLTFGELKSFMNYLPAQMQQLAMRDRKMFVQQYALMQRLAEMAEQAKLDQESPAKEQLAFNRMYVMMNAQLNQAMNDIIVPTADQEKYYLEHKDRFSQVRVKVIYVSFASNPSSPASPGGKKYLTEAEAKAKIEKILADIRGGAEFVKLVKQHSDDQTSAAKDGDFGTIRRTDSIPEAIRNAVFALKTGQVSEPVRQPNGFYVFRAEEITVRPFKEVQDEVFNELKQVRFKQWMDETTRNLNVKYESEAFFKTGPAPSAGK